MKTIINERVTDNVAGAVWLAALILTYQRSSLDASMSSTAFKQSEIRALAEKLCTKKVHQPRVGQWCNGDHPNSNYNYLREVSGQRRLTKLGEFSFNKEYPEDLLDGETWVIRMEGQNAAVKYTELLEWYKTVYSKGVDIESRTAEAIQPRLTVQTTSKTTTRPNDHGKDITDMGFLKATLQFDGFDKENLFTLLYSKTVEETIEHYRYSRLAAEVQNRYPNHLHYRIGDFLFQLKKANDILYTKFLNSNGDQRYCSFRLVDKELLHKRGIYYFTIDGVVMYIGRCLDNFQSRINANYGNISPKNCYIDGQSTNCRINSIINSVGDKVELWVLVLDNDNEIIEKEMAYIRRYSPTWNLTS